MTNPENKFALGVVSMARNCQAAVELVRKGQWTLDTFDRWLVAVIADDAEHAEAMIKDHF